MIQLGQWSKEKKKKSSKVGVRKIGKEDLKKRFFSNKANPKNPKWQKNGLV